MGAFVGLTPNNREEDIAWGRKILAHPAIAGDYTTTVRNYPAERVYQVLIYSPPHSVLYFLFFLSFFSLPQIFW